MDTGTGILTIIDFCIKYGEKLIKIYDDYKEAEQLVAETLLRLRTEWLKTESQMASLRRVWSSLDSSLQTNQLALLGMLEKKLREAVVLLDDIIGDKTADTAFSTVLLKRGAVRRANYSMRIKDSLDKTVAELTEWRGLFDPSWYLLARIANDELDRNLKAQAATSTSGSSSSDKSSPLKLLKGLRKSVRELQSSPGARTEPIKARDFLGARTPIACSTLTIAQIEGRIQQGIADAMLLNPAMDPSKTIHSVKTLTKALSRMDPSTFGLLRCCGVISHIDRYEFVFEAPKNVEKPKSLRDLLFKSQVSLNSRLEMAKQLAQSVCYLHAAGFVHKNVRPENVLVFDSRDGERSFLFGFETFVVFKKIHSSRQGNDPERRYEMKHDIYSFGVCLLEIGLWRSFIKTDRGKTIVEFRTETAGEAKQRAQATKARMLQETNRSLSRHVGHRYKEVVEKCLTCLDDDTAWDQVDDSKVADIDVGVEFIENVLLQLYEIVI